ncbi:MULE domain-containing protein, partial [Aphis craccivora]
KGSKLPTNHRYAIATTHELRQALSNLPHELRPFDFDTKKIKHYLILMDTKYKCWYHKTLKNDVQRWSCCKKTCKSYIRLNNENEIIERANDHNHIKDSVEVLNRQQLSNNLKRKAVEEIYAKTSKLIHGALSKDIPTLTTYDLTLIRNNIHHARSSTIPKLPDNLPDLHNVLLNENIQTNNRDDNFLLLPKTVYTIFYNTYIKAFSHLKSEFLKNNIKFSPKIIFADFEKAIHSSLLIVWPSVQMKGCRFHLDQSWWRKIQTYFFGLPFLKPNELEDCFTAVTIYLLYIYLCMTILYPFYPKMKKYSSFPIIY